MAKPINNSNDLHEAIKEIRTSIYQATQCSDLLDILEFAGENYDTDYDTLDSYDRAALDDLGTLVIGRAQLFGEACLLQLDKSASEIQDL